jgi:anti-anti-sigma factor
VLGLRISVVDGPPPAVCVTGEVDLSNYQDLIAGVVARAPREGEWVLDLTQVTYMDSTGVRALLTLRDHFDDRFMLRPTEQVVRILEVLGLDAHFRHFASRGTE